MIVKYLCLGFTNTYNWKILHLKTHHISESQRAWAKQPPAEKPHTDMSEANSCSAQHAARRGYAPLLGEPEKERAKRKVRPQPFCARTALQPGNNKAGHFRGPRASTAVPHLRTAPAESSVRSAPSFTWSRPRRGACRAQPSGREACGAGSWFSTPARIAVPHPKTGQSKHARRGFQGDPHFHHHPPTPRWLCSQSPGFLFLFSLFPIKEGRECGGKRWV